MEDGEPKGWNGTWRIEKFDAPEGERKVYEHVVEDDECATCDFMKGPPRDWPDDAIVFMSATNVATGERRIQRMEVRNMIFARGWFCVTVSEEDARAEIAGD